MINFEGKTKKFSQRELDRIIKELRVQIGKATNLLVAYHIFSMTGDLQGILTPYYLLCYGNVPRCIINKFDQEIDQSINLKLQNVKSCDYEQVKLFGIPETSVSIGHDIKTVLPCLRSVLLSRSAFAVTIAAFAHCDLDIDVIGIDEGEYDFYLCNLAFGKYGYMPPEIVAWFGPVTHHAVEGLNTMYDEENIE